MPEVLTSERLTKLKNLLGDENVVATCSGVNYSIYVTDSRLLIGRRFGLGESILNVPHSKVSTLELVTKSLIPPLTVAIFAAVAVALVWWFPGQQRLGMPAYPYDYVTAGIACIFLGSMIATLWRRRIAILRIGILGGRDPITVRLVSNSRATSVFRALKG